jgi:hypothetical protein
VAAPLERPLITVLEVAASNTDSAALLVRVHLSVHNPNATTMYARALDWQLSLAGQPPVRGRLSFDTTVAGKRSSSVWLRFELAPQTARQLAGRLHEGTQAFHIHGTVHLFSERGDMGAVFDQQGRLAPW